MKPKTRKKLFRRNLFVDRRRDGVGSRRRLVPPLLRQRRVRIARSLHSEVLPGGGIKTLKLFML